MIALDFQLYDIVENKGFQELIQLLQPQYNIPRRTTFSRTVVPRAVQEYSRRAEGRNLRGLWNRDGVHPVYRGYVNLKGQ
ncbi:hypothetical protein HPB47_020459 [Ixodes persulcatus]|uniref:Uncharacterized protein n=1 Tax=Ixodes persulcatus TaxID=34615 RepID=A0AC60QHJ7_IXOPE|nr:hypothetical protein HPB47_020459 [Ixodes persulcatus]